MIITKPCHGCGNMYDGRSNSKYCSVCLRAHARKHRKAYEQRQLAAAKSIMHELDEPTPPRRLRQLQRVTWWNVRTGRIEERWE